MYFLHFFYISLQAQRTFLTIFGYLAKAPGPKNGRKEDPKFIIREGKNETEEKVCDRG